MAWQTIASTINGVSCSINAMSWKSKIMLYFAFVGTAMAMNGDGQELIDLMSSQQGMDSLNNLVNVKEYIKTAMEGESIENICDSLNTYIGMCQLLGSPSVHVDGGMEILHEEHIYGQSNNPAGFVCNIVNLFREALSQEQLSTCDERLQSATMS